MVIALFLTWKCFYCLLRSLCSEIRPNTLVILLKLELTISYLVDIYEWKPHRAPHVHQVKKYSQIEKVTLNGTGKI